MTRPAVLASVQCLPALRAVWSHRGLFDAVPELHLFDGGTFFAAEAAQKRFPEGKEGFHYTGTFADAVSEGRLSLVLPLLHRVDGALQGLLEFSGVPYAGCGMTGSLLAAHRPHRKAVLLSFGLEDDETSQPAEVAAVLGNEEPLVVGARGEAAEFCRQVYRGLGLSGWALVGVSPAGPGWKWNRIEVQPDLAPGSPFVSLLAAAGWDLEAVLQKLLDWGSARHDTENGLKSLFKDKI